jgi:sigma-B regulation protein RsbU (phosphoserine phosphatase)
MFSIGDYIIIPQKLIDTAIEKHFVITSSFRKIPCSGELKAIDLHSYGFNETMIVPLIYENSMKGFFVINGKEDRNTFTVTDREYLEIISSSATIALLNIELLNETAEKARMQTELEMAETVQKTLFPNEPIVNDDVEVHGYFRSASETGGDWYYTLMDSYTKSLYVFIGDVTGHGVPAALNTAAAYSFIRTLNLIRQNIFTLLSKIKNMSIADSPVTKQMIGLLNPGHVLTLLNQVFLKKNEKTFLMTFFSSLIDIKGKKLYFANAGHEVPLILRAHNNELEPLLSSGVRLGDQIGASFEQKCVDLYSGDIVFWYTDGFIEAPNSQGREYGSRRFYRTLRHAGSLKSTKDILDYCVNDFSEFTSGMPLVDDVTLVVAKIL